MDIVDGLRRAAASFQHNYSARSFVAAPSEYAHMEKLCDQSAAAIERLRAALGEAVSIASGSGADFTWQAQERLRVLRRMADGVDEQKEVRK